MGEAESLTIGKLDDLQIGPCDLKAFDTIVHTAAISAVKSKQDLQKRPERKRCCRKSLVNPQSLLGEWSPHVPLASVSRS